MKRFEYRCECGETRESTDPTPPVCKCGKLMRRDYSSVSVAYHPTKGGKR